MANLEHENVKPESSNPANRPEDYSGDPQRDLSQNSISELHPATPDPQIATSPESSILALNNTWASIDNNYTPTPDAQLTPDTPSESTSNLKSQQILSQKSPEKIPTADSRTNMVHSGKDALLHPPWENQNLLPKSPSRIIGKADFQWRKELSEGGQKLYQFLLSEGGDNEVLPDFAADEQIDFDSILTELRNHYLLDETVPGRIKIVSNIL